MIVIIDALRYDFAVPFQPSGEHGEPRQFHNALPVLYETARTRPDLAFLLPFIADPPTATLQRLKGLMTGTLPTFIDAGANFAGTAIEEDNLLAQMRSQGKTMVHLGDDTWQSLFPGYFHETLSHPYDSFNVWDLHTVDDGVTTHLLPLLNSRNGTQWDFLFAHFLGVDHAGHRYGPDHPAMRDKLQQMNQVVLQMMEAVDDETVLVVMGDHGMDTKGDHGGESDEEIEAALWMYSARPAFGRTQADFITPPENGKIRPVRQIDLVSTLSLLLGLPIPFNNIGAPIAEAFSLPNGPDWRALATVNQITVGQIQKYEEEYSKARNLDRDPDQQSFYEATMLLLESAVNTVSVEDELFKEAYLAFRDYEGTILSLYRRLWTNFNLSDMALGIFVLVSGLMVLIVFSASRSRVKAIDFIKAAPLGLMPGSLWSWLTLFFTTSQAAGFASNSYTIHEDSILLFFLTTFGLIGCVASLRQAEASNRYLGSVQSSLFTLLTRLASFSRLCREEQMPGCRSTFYASSNSSTSAPWQVFLPFVIALALPAFAKARYKGTSSYTGSAKFWLGFCFRIGLLLIALYWILDAADNGDWLQHAMVTDTLKKAELTVSRCVIGIALVVGSVMIVWSEPCIDISLARQGQTEEDDQQQPTPAIIILGYANAHGARYFLLLPIFILLTSVLLPPMGQFSIAICVCQIFCLLEVLDTNNLTINSSSSSKSTAVGPIIIAMLGSFHFFKTGHQATLASIQWNAAFVPFRTVIYPWSPILIVLNTFGAQILCAAAVPLTVLWKRPVSRESGWMHDLLRDVMAAMLWHVSYYATIHLATTMWAGHLRRHLMLYRVFMPRFLMSSALLVVVDVVLLLVAWVAFRVNTLSVGELMGI